ncbi:hypothetical protein L596_018567 [Steinernema carpocapsae]|uniref:Secreted protein n=1 Tax=Steinernema carpocapsae TaxID=34508 RepID=A0A4U5N5V9_STECR|nr:hypothetical protein L596_018567 [Steinernema carpocapsae]
MTFCCSLLAAFLVSVLVASANGKRDLAELLRESGLSGDMPGFFGRESPSRRIYPFSYNALQQQSIPPMGIFNTNFAPPYATNLLGMNGVGNGYPSVFGRMMTPQMMNNFQDSRFLALMNRANTFPLAHHPPHSSGRGLPDDGWNEWGMWSVCSPIDGFQVRTRSCLHDGHAGCVGRALQKRRCGHSRSY